MSQPVKPLKALVAWVGGKRRLAPLIRDRSDCSKSYWRALQKQLARFSLVAIGPRDPFGELARLGEERRRQPQSIIMRFHPSLLALCTASAGNAGTRAIRAAAAMPSPLSPCRSAAYPNTRCPAIGTASPGRARALASLGVAPCRALKCREKCAQSAKPASSAISVIERVVL